jgi:aldose 1-epimerase
VRRATVAAALIAASPSFAATAVQVPYGSLKDGARVTQTILRNDNGMEVRFINYGAALTDIIVPDRNGKMANVNLAFGNIADWESKNKNYGLGAVMGRYAGRIAGARFNIDGKEYRLKANNGPNALHGGGDGFDNRVWRTEPFTHRGLAGAVLTYSSPSGEQGFPGKLDVRITYTLTNDNGLQIDYDARTDAATVLNLTNHAYFNLAGAGSGSVLNHQLQIFADRYVEFTVASIPTGAYKPVTGSPFDFQTPTTIAGQMKHRLVGERGYNHSWILPDQRGDVAKFAARLSDSSSGRVMDVLTTEPALQIYAAGYFSGRDESASGSPLRPHDGLAIGAQHISNAPNDPRLPSTLLRPGEVYRSTTIYRFGVLK